jgi:16S rRNA (cytidine1402-2'-O)-methyltransferase
MPADHNSPINASSGVLHLIPVGLGDAPITEWLPSEAQTVAGQLSTYIAENAKTARAFLKLTPLTQPLQEITIHELNPRIDDATLQTSLRFATVSQSV